MNGLNLMQFAMNMLKQNPNVARNPQAQTMLQVLQSGDAQKGQQIAQNLCQTYGITPEEFLCSVLTLHLPLPWHSLRPTRTSTSSTL